MVDGYLTESQSNKTTIDLGMRVVEAKRVTRMRQWLMFKIVFSPRQGSILNALINRVSSVAGQKSCFASASSCQPGAFIVACCAFWAGCGQLCLSDKLMLTQHALVIF